MPVPSWVVSGGVGMPGRSWEGNERKTELSWVERAKPRELKGWGFWVCHRCDGGGWPLSEG